MLKALVFFAAVKIELFCPWGTDVSEAGFGLRGTFGFEFGEVLLAAIEGLTGGCMAVLGPKEGLVEAAGGVGLAGVAGEALDIDLPLRRAILCCIVRQ